MRSHVDRASVQKPCCRHPEEADVFRPNLDNLRLHHIFDDTQDEPALGLREEALKNCTIPALLVNNWGAGRHDGMHMESVTRAVAAAMPKAEPPLVSAEMRVWFGGILGFIKKHGSV